MRLGSYFPKLKATSTNGPIVFPHDIGARWSVVMFHAQAFAPVCASEIVALSRLAKKQLKELCVYSVIPESVETLSDWIADIKTKTGVTVDHTCIADPESHFASAFFETSRPFDGRPGPRGHFIFDTTQRLAAKTQLPRQVGFSSEELVRMTSALALTRHGEMVAPANWNFGVPMLEIGRRPTLRA
ncbi:redoxin domain-containing protein [Shimia ponticola]|uniref:redoxin domain-containing protein n=1 Tax=Shimia ponticola TaxID=2582893 RepID=UPI0011BF8653|nr:redoxin domain-containing protein [Shimia ponticola]